MNRDRYKSELYRLASLYGVQIAYKDMWGKLRRVGSEPLMAVLEALGCPIHGIEDIPSAIKFREYELSSQICEPVMVAWDGKLPQIILQSKTRLSHHLSVVLNTEDGSKVEFSRKKIDFKYMGCIESDNGKLWKYLLAINQRLEFGYHELVVSENGDKCHRIFIISAPRHAYNSGDYRSWGLFAPLYALHSHNSWGTGDLRDLDTLIDWLHNIQADFISTLPLYPLFWDKPEDLSPYAPVSRLFWNELYIDINQLVSELGVSAYFSEMLSHDFVFGIEKLRQANIVDFRRQNSIKRSFIESVIQHPVCSAKIKKIIAEYSSSKPEVVDYARFRAVCERKGDYWRSWEADKCNGSLTEADYDSKVLNYYIFTQWAIEHQLSALKRSSSFRRVRLGLDLPLGVHPDGYDSWREKYVFVHQLRTGAPPDNFFSGGQDWGIPPLHPYKLREQRYSYFIRVLKNTLRYAGILRIDHIMGFHRLYVIPPGFDAAYGMYMRYRPEEFYAIVSLESHRNQCIILGEDLGTVPTVVRRYMQSHGLNRHYVFQFEIDSDRERIGVPGKNYIAAVNTHDTPTFAAFWHGLDIDERYHRGMLDEEQRKSEIERRARIRQIVIDFLQKHKYLSVEKEDVKSVLEAVLLYLASSQARLVLINLEDLWGETLPQNMPGTVDDKVNYCRKLKYGIEDFTHFEWLNEILYRVDKSRKLSGSFKE